jgi:DNA processing protein
MPDPPAEVNVRGDLTVLNGPSIAMVGTRRATPRGLAVARGLAAELAAHGWVIVSGLALGIDGEAHRGALSVQGKSVGVMATGSDRVYPAAHRRLRERLETSGCTLTEFPAGTPPLKHHFPRRNRLIAGLAQGVIVVEAPYKSGAMLTAMLALDYDREVFAVPGPVDLETSRGCHHLLREGAHLLENVNDVTRVLGTPEWGWGATGKIGSGSASGNPDPVPGSSARWIMDRLDLEGISRDRLRERWPGSEESWQEGLLALELAGLIRRLPGGRLARRIWSG